jgi:hypothetical protein
MLVEGSRPQRTLRFEEAKQGHLDGWHQLIFGAILEMSRGGLAKQVAKMGLGPHNLTVSTR